MAGIIILTAWLSLLAGFVGGLALHAYKLTGVSLLSRKFLAETATVALLFGACIYGIQFAGVALEIAK